MNTHKKPIKLALTGKMRSGKDTVAERLYFEHKFEFPMSFGSTLKHYAHQIFPWVDTEPKPRDLYQFMNVMRDYDEDVWIKHLAFSVDRAENDLRTKGIVVTDARQENEIKWLRDNGFIIVKVDATDETRRKRMEQAGEEVSEEYFAHKTESYVDDIEADYVIQNDGTWTELEHKVDALVNVIRPELRGDVE